MFSSLLVILTTLAATANSLQSSCEMRLHNNGAKVGKVSFSSSGNKQNIEVILQGDPEKITPGNHALTVRSKAVRGKPVNCGSSGGVLKKGKKVLGDLGRVRAGKRGEVNQYHMITVDPDAMEEVLGVPEALRQCPPEAYKYWPDGREELIEDVAQAEIEMHMMLMEGKEAFIIIEKMPDCYQPASSKDMHTLNKPMFYLRGKKSIVGKAVVLEGDNGEPIACCTLRKDK